MAPQFLPVTEYGLCMGANSQDLTGENTRTPKHMHINKIIKNTNFSYIFSQLKLGFLKYVKKCHTFF